MTKVSFEEDPLGIAAMATGLTEQQENMARTLQAREARLREWQEGRLNEQLTGEWLEAAQQQLPGRYMTALCTDIDTAVSTETVMGPEAAIARPVRDGCWQRALRLLGEPGDQQLEGYSATEVLPPDHLLQRSFSDNTGHECIMEARGVVRPTKFQAAMASLALLGLELLNDEWGGTQTLTNFAFKGTGHEALSDAQHRLKVEMLTNGTFNPDDIARIRLNLMAGGRFTLYSSYPYIPLQAAKEYLASRRATSAGRAWSDITGPRTALTGIVLRYGLAQNGRMVQRRELLVPHPDLPVIEEPPTEPPVTTVTQRIARKVRDHLPLPTPGQLLARTATGARVPYSDTMWANQMFGVVNWNSPEGRAVSEHPKTLERLTYMGGAAIRATQEHYAAIDTLLQYIDA